MYGKKKMMKKGGKKKFPDLTGDGKVTRADILKGRGVFRKGGGNTGETSDEMERKSDRAKKEEIRKIKRQLDSYTPQTQRKPQGPPTPVAGNRMGGKLEGSAKNFAAIAERAKKAKKPR
tara:strand:- start:184 stop:540 length:357 start_codon:yes stop_codon:yes gene_type:complete